MPEKIRVGILFGGSSREREVSFAGGRTVFDNLDKSLFEAVPIFVDNFNQFILLNWEYLYKGSIRDFYPPVKFLPDSPNGFQVYADSIKNPDKTAIAGSVGRLLRAEELKNEIDFAFLSLHGAFGEDGSIQGLLEWLHIPYSGSDILGSAFGIDKAIQKKLMANAGFLSKPFDILHRTDWTKMPEADGKAFLEKTIEKLGEHFVIRPSRQGSSLGVKILTNPDWETFKDAVWYALGDVWIKSSDWKNYTPQQKTTFVKNMADIRVGIGFPVVINEQIIHHPEELLIFLEECFSQPEHESVRLTYLHPEQELVLESFIDGKEFSCIVIKGLDGKALALPPTEIRKKQDFFDYRSKYLPGLSRKVTPIELPEDQVEKICRTCEKLFDEFRFRVYARIDGFINKNEEIYLNDPNTTSGMLPSSFFFHQAAEAGLNPSQFITYIIETSLQESIERGFEVTKSASLKNRLNALLLNSQKQVSNKKRIAVIMGGFSSERHISVESGRNIYEKLSSSEKYLPVPVFLTGKSGAHEMYVLPVNIMLKDNADDIREKLSSNKRNSFLEKLQQKAASIRNRYVSAVNADENKSITYHELAEMVDGVFIALHGRPGEDGEVQAELEKVHLPYNGSGIESSQITINKFETGSILRENGFSTTFQMIAEKDEWQKGRNIVLEKVRQNPGYPLIAKPIDDGCSSAVVKVESEAELIAFAEMIFRNDYFKLPEQAAQLLKINTSDEFPVKDAFLIEKLIAPEADDVLFMEITTGLVTHQTDEGIKYEVFEPSEALAGNAILSLEEKFLAGEGQNITPARFEKSGFDYEKIAGKVKATLESATKLLNIEGYTRIDAFVRVKANGSVETIFIEFNSLPGMTPATCIFHQAAINHYTPYEFIDKILTYAFSKHTFQAGKISDQ